MVSSSRANSTQRSRHGPLRGHATPAGPAVEVTLTPAPATVDLGGPIVETWAYGGEVPGPLVRLRAGETLRATLENHLPQRTTIHWHGVRVPFGMDGVPGAPYPSVGPGESFVYEFAVPDPGTYFFHPHVGLQVDRGLCAVLVVEDLDRRVGVAGVGLERHSDFGHGDQ